MGYNKFIKKSGEVLLDLTGDTVTADKLLSGATAHGKDGKVVTGTLVVEDLDSVITELETKVSTLNTTLDGKASGGGSVETCSVSHEGMYACVTYIAIENGSIALQHLENPNQYGGGSTQESFSINNVLVGSNIVVEQTGECNYTVTSGAELLETLNWQQTGVESYKFIFKITGNAELTVVEE